MTKIAIFLNKFTLFCLLAVSSSPSSATESSSQLKFLIVVFNNGLRSPLQTFPKDEHQESAWPQGFGQLTPKGIEAQHEVGQFLRNRYDGYLNTTYLVHEIYVQSLDIDRCLMSASALLSGLYHPVSAQIWSTDVQWQPIPVHTKPTDQDPFLARCPMLEALWNETLNSQEVQDFFELKSVYKVAMEQLVGTNISNVFELAYVFDAITCESENGMEEPGWPAHLKELFMTDIYPFLQYVYHNRTEAKQLISGQYVNEVVKFFNLRMQGILDSRLKAYFLSADDRILRSLLSGLDVYNYLVVPFSATVMLELRLDDELGYFVNVILRNSTEELFYLTIPGCERDCPMDLFLNLTQDVIPENWSLECFKLKELAFVKVAQKLLILAVGAVAGLILMIGCFSLCCYKKLKRHAPKAYAAARTERNNSFPEQVPMMNTSIASSDLED